jgi:hypothetical protein
VLKARKVVSVAMTRLTAVLQCSSSVRFYYYYNLLLLLLLLLLILLAALENLVIHNAVQPAPSSPVLTTQYLLTSTLAAPKSC